MNQRSQAELSRVKAPEPEPEVAARDPAQFVDAELAAKGPRERRRREAFSFVQAGKLQRDAQVMRLRVSQTTSRAPHASCRPRVQVRCSGTMPLISSSTEVVATLADGREAGGLAGSVAYL